MLAHAYLRQDNILDRAVPPDMPIPALAEVQVALQEAVANVTGDRGEALKRRLRTGTVVTNDDRNWELRWTQERRRINLSRAIAVDMESATVATQGFRMRVPYGTLLCVSDKPLHGEIKLPGAANAFYERAIGEHLQIGIAALELLQTSARRCIRANCAASTSRRSADRGSSPRSWRDTGSLHGHGNVARIGQRARRGAATATCSAFEECARLRMGQRQNLRQPCPAGSEDLAENRAEAGGGRNAISLRHRTILFEGRRHDLKARRPHHGHACCQPNPPGRGHARSDAGETAGAGRNRDAVKRHEIDARPGHKVPYQRNKPFGLLRAFRQPGG